MTPRLLVLGSGWGATSLVRSLRKTTKFAVTVASPRDHMLFTPLLTSTATGALEHRSIIEPIRPLTAKRNAQFLSAAATQIESAANRVHLKAAELPFGSEKSSSFVLPYDAMVVSVGCVVNTFNLPGVNEHAFFMKEASDARTVRRRMHDLFEAAALPNVFNEHQRRALLTFVVCGAGPTGVELTAEIGDGLRDMKRSARYGDLADEARVVLVEASGNILSSFDQNLRSYALRRLRDQRIEVKLGSAVKSVQANSVTLKDSSNSGDDYSQLDEQLPCGMVVWTAGVAPRKVITESDLPKTKNNFVRTDNYLLAESAGGAPVFAIGDCASIDGSPLVNIAQVAEQQGIYVADILNRTEGLTNEQLRAAGEPFAFASKGMLAYVGGWTGVAKVVTKMNKADEKEAYAVKYRGLLAWLTWRLAYLSKLGSLRNKLQVPFDFVKTTLFGRDISSF